MPPVWYPLLAVWLHLRPLSGGKAGAAEGGRAQAWQRGKGGKSSRNVKPDRGQRGRPAQKGAQCPGLWLELGGGGGGFKGPLLGDFLDAVVCVEGLCVGNV